MKCRLPGITARSRLLERIRLTPEGIDHAAHRRLIDRLLADGQKIFAMAYHSPSLQPGNTPYVRDNAEPQDLGERSVEKKQDRWAKAVKLVKAAGGERSVADLAGQLGTRLN